MNKLTDNTQSLLTRCRGFLPLIAAAALTGCYVEVSHELEADYDTDSHYSTELADFSTDFLVDAALIPLALSAESAAMVADPDAYTTPRSRLASRAVIIETTYAYLFDDWDCDYGGYTESEAEASTTSYDDGYTFVDLELNAEAFDCRVYTQGAYHTVNSDLGYDVTGWYDDWENEIDSLNGKVDGWVSVDYDGQYIAHRNLSFSSYAVSGNDIVSEGQSRVELDNGRQTLFADFRTTTDPHLYRSAEKPHYGSVKFSTGSGWVRLSFESSGVWREDSDGYDRFYSWNEL